MKQSNYERTQDALGLCKRFSGEHAIAAALWQIALTYASAVDVQTGMATPKSSEDTTGQAPLRKEER